MPKKKVNINKQHLITIRLTDSMLKTLEEVTENLELRRSEVIRKAIQEFLKRNI